MKKLIPFVIVLPFFIMLYRYVNADFYYDEVYSLVNYIFVPWRQIVLEYVNSNNHFLASIINAAYLKLIGENMLSLMDHPWVIRAPQLVYCVATFTIIYKFCHRFVGYHTARLALLLMATSIPYYNYVCQVRGYSLSVMLMTAIIYLIFDVETRVYGDIKKQILLAIVTALFIYSACSNLYVVLGIAAYYLYRILRYKYVYPYDPDVYLPLLAGVIIAIIMYLPMIPGMLADEHLSRHHHYFYFPVLYKALPSVLWAFTSWRIPLVIMAAAGCYIEKEYIPALPLYLVVILSPFVFGFIRGDYWYERFYLHLIPVFCILVAHGLFLFYCKFIRRDFGICFAAVFLLCALTFVDGINNMDKNLVNDIRYGDKAAIGLTNNYWQAHYAPLKLLTEFKANYPQDKPFVVWYCDKAAMLWYLKKAGINAWDSRNIVKAIAQHDTVYVLSAFKSKIESEFRNAGYNIDRIDKRPVVESDDIFLSTLQAIYAEVAEFTFYEDIPLQYHNIYTVSRIK